MMELMDSQHVQMDTKEGEGRVKEASVSSHPEPLMVARVVVVCSWLSAVAQLHPWLALIVASASTTASA
jgi:hypothetical protein